MSSSAGKASDFNRKFNAVPVDSNPQTGLIQKPLGRRSLKPCRLRHEIKNLSQATVSPCAMEAF